MAETPPTAHERRKKPPAQPPSKRVYASIAVAFGWLLFLALWLFYYATSFSIVQNIDFLNAKSYRQSGTLKNPYKR